MSDDLFAEPRRGVDPKLDTPCDACADPGDCLYRTKCRACEIRFLARLPLSMQATWMTTELAPKVEAERLRLAKAGKL